MGSARAIRSASCGPRAGGERARPATKGLAAAARLGAGAHEAVVGGGQGLSLERGAVDARPALHRRAAGGRERHDHLVHVEARRGEDDAEGLARGRGGPAPALLEADKNRLRKGERAAA